MIMKTHSNKSKSDENNAYTRMKKNKLHTIMNAMNGTLRNCYKVVKSNKEIYEMVCSNKTNPQSEDAKALTDQLEKLQIRLQIEEQLSLKQAKEVDKNTMKLEGIKAKHMKFRNKCSMMKLRSQQRDYKKFVLNRKKSILPKYEIKTSFTKNMTESHKTHNMKSPSTATLQIPISLSKA